MWCGVVWSSVVCGVVWCGVVWSSVVCGVVWCGVVCGVVWCVVWCGVVCGVVWCVVWCEPACACDTDMVWCGASPPQWSGARLPQTPFPVMAFLVKKPKESNLKRLQVHLQLWIMNIIINHLAPPPLEASGQQHSAVTNCPTLP